MKEIQLLKSQITSGPTGPGPSTYIASDTESGFFGELSSNEFINTANLSTLVGITAGSVFNAAPQWLKFSIADKVIFTPKNPLRNYIYWIDINNAECVYGTRTITIGQRDYIIRLFKGANSDPTNQAENTNNNAWDDQSEWGKTMVKIYNGVFASYAAIDISVDPGNGSSSWCQESNTNTPNNKVIRGGGSAGAWFFGFRNYQTESSTYPKYRSWRPVLELVV